MNKILIILLTSALIITLLSFKKIVPPDNLPNPENQNKRSTYSQKETPVPTRPITSENSGQIEGIVDFPDSESFPQSLMVCAQDISDMAIYCRNNFDKKNKSPYVLQVPEGSYQVFSSIREFGSYRAYYNEFVKCGMTKECKSKKPIIINIKAGSTAKEINPIDWLSFEPKM